MKKLALIFVIVLAVCWSCRKDTEEQVITVSHQVLEEPFMIAAGREYGIGWLFLDDCTLCSLDTCHLPSCDSTMSITLDAPGNPMLAFDAKVIYGYSYGSGPAWQFELFETRPVAEDELPENGSISQVRYGISEWDNDCAVGLTNEFIDGHLEWKEEAWIYWDMYGESCNVLTEGNTGIAAILVGDRFGWIKLRWEPCELTLYLDEWALVDQPCVGIQAGATTVY